MTRRELDRLRALGLEPLPKLNFSCDQVVCGSNWATDENMVPLVKYARGVVAPERLKGFMMATWEATLPKSEEKLSRGIDQLAEGFAKYPA